jgi:hypothetical protein
MIVFITDIVCWDLTDVTYSCAAMLYQRRISIDPVYGLQTQSPTEIRKMVASVFAKDRLSCPTQDREVSAKFSPGLTVFLMKNLGAQDFICSD